MADYEQEVEVGLDPVAEALLRAEAERRGLRFEQVLAEKFAVGLDQSAGDFSDLKRPSKGQQRH